MLPELSQKSKLYSLLHRIELNLVKQTIHARCPHCGGPLHHSNYMRKPRGGPEDLPEKLLVRYSLCCGRQGCRKRTLPPSVLFMGRRVYWANVILVVVTLRQSTPCKYSKAALMRHFGMERKTINRWLKWFQEIFPTTSQWQRLQGRVSVSCRNLPSALIEIFIKGTQSIEQALVACLRFLASGHDP